MSSKKTGSQKPRIAIEPKRAYSDGPDCGELATAYGLTPDQWQQDVLDVWLGRDKKDLFTSTTCCVSVPRQNGKNALLEMRELYGLTVLGERILHTSHAVKTSAEAFRRLSSFFENKEQYPELYEACKFIRRTNGQEAIELYNGAVIRFSARSRGASRGMTFDCVVLDECAELTDEQLEAIMSTMAAAPLGNRQLIYTGTPPGPTSPGEVFERVRNRALSGKDKHMSWHEWSVETIGDVSDRDRWYATNPALGIRLEESFTEAEMSSMTAEGFARERLGWWEENGGAARIFAKSDWDATRITADEVPDGKIAAGIKFSRDGATVSLAIAVKTDERKLYVELIAQESTSRGIRWLAEWICERKNRLCVAVIDGVGNATNLADMCLSGEAGDKMPRKAILLPTSSNVATAAASFENNVIEHKIYHYNGDLGEQDVLDNSVINAKKRKIGIAGSWGFDGQDPTPVEAASLALWGVMTSRRNPGRKAKLL